MNMELELNIGKENYHKALLLVVSVVSNLNLTDTEIDIISTLLKNNCHYINPDTKEFLRHTLDKSKFDVNMYVKKLKDKGIISHVQDSRGVYKISQSIINILQHNDVSFKFKNESLLVNDNNL